MLPAAPPPPPLQGPSSCAELPWAWRGVSAQQAGRTSRLEHPELPAPRLTPSDLSPPRKHPRAGHGTGGCPSEGTGESRMRSHVPSAWPLGKGLDWTPLPVLPASPGLFFFLTISYIFFLPETPLLLYSASSKPAPSLLSQLEFLPESLTPRGRPPHGRLPP